MNKADFSPDFLEKLLTYQGEGGVSYIEKFNKDWIRKTCEEKGEFPIIRKYFARYDNKGLDLIDFVKELLAILVQKEDETLFLTIGLIDFYQDICDSFNLEGSAKSSDILNYVIELFSNKEFRSHRIQTKKLSEVKKFGSEKINLRDVDLFAPTVYGKSSHGISRLLGSRVITDSSHHNLNSINRVYFGGEARKIFSLDPFVSYISVYDLNCIFEKKITSKEKIDNKSIQIVDFAWSNKQKRIGACLKNHSLSFWDFVDDFQFEKNFKISQNQTQLWYIEFLDAWITTDQTHSLHVWDIEKEALAFTLSSPKIKNSILQVVPLELYKLVAVASRDKRVTFWDFDKRAIALEIEQPHSGVHSVAWSNAFQVFLTAGFEKNISVWNIHPVYHDSTLLGELTGHETFVTGVEFVDETPMVVSTDETSILKVWDIRTMQCVQTIEIESIVSITKIISLYSHKKVCLVGSRINLMEFDMNNKKPIKQEEQTWPIKAEYNSGYNEIVICTKKDLRFMNISTGRIHKIYGGILPDEEDEITTFKITHNEKRFILGDFRGNLGLYSYGTGELSKSLAPHTNEVMDLRIDSQHRMVFSASWDCSITVQKETRTGYEIQRTVKNIHNSKGIAFLEVSIFHSLFLTATNQSTIYIWDYQEMKVISLIITEGKTEPTAAIFTNGFAYLIVADATGKLHFLHFERYGNQKIIFKKVFTLLIPQQDDNCFVNKMYIEGDYVDQETGSRLYAATNNGEIHIYDLKVLFEVESAKRAPHFKNRPEYNVERCLKEDFSNQFKEYSVEKFFLEDEDCRADQGTFFQTSQIIQIKIPLLQSFQAHQDLLSTMIIIQTPIKKLLTTSLDGYVKIWTLNGNLLGALNINHPLPRIWRVDNDDFVGNSKKVSRAIKLLENIKKRYQSTMSNFESQKLFIENFLKKFSGSGSASPLLRNTPEPVMTSQKNQIVLMKDEYTIKDLQYDKAKIIFQKELQGPTLRQMDKVKTISGAERERENVRIERERTDEENYLKAIKNSEEMNRRKEFIHMMNGYQNNHFLDDQIYSKSTQILEHKLASFRNKIKTLQFGDLSGEKTRKKKPFELPEALLEHTSPTARIISKIYEEKKKGSLTARNNSSVDSKGLTKLKTLQPHVPPEIIATSRASRPHRSSLMGVEFIDYAQQKLKNINEPLTPEIFERTRKSEVFKRKQQKKDFTKIINHLEDIKRKSRVSGVYQKDADADQNKTTPMNRVNIHHAADSDLSTLSQFKSHYRNYKLRTEQSSDLKNISGDASARNDRKRFHTEAIDEISRFSEKKKLETSKSPAKIILATEPDAADTSPSRRPVIKPKISKKSLKTRLQEDFLPMADDDIERQGNKSGSRGISLPSIRKGDSKNIDFFTVHSAYLNKKN